MNKDVEDIARAARKNGWVVEKTEGQHYEWFYPETGGYFYSGSTSSDHRVPRIIKNMMKKVIDKKQSRGIGYENMPLAQRTEQ